MSSKFWRHCWQRTKVEVSPLLKHNNKFTRTPPPRPHCRQLRSLRFFCPYLYGTNVAFACNDEGIHINRGLHPQTCQPDIVSQTSHPRLVSQLEREHTTALFTYHTDTCAQCLSFNSKPMQWKCLSSPFFFPPYWYNIKIEIPELIIFFFCSPNADSHQY